MQYEQDDRDRGGDDAHGHRGASATGEARKASLKAAASGMPLAVLWLVLGAIYFTVRMGLVQLKNKD